MQIEWRSAHRAAPQKVAEAGRRAAELPLRQRVASCEQSWATHCTSNHALRCTHVVVAACRDHGQGSGPHAPCSQANGPVWREREGTCMSYVANRADNGALRGAISPHLAVALARRSRAAIGGILSSVYCKHKRECAISASRQRLKGGVTRKPRWAAASSTQASRAGGFHIVSPCQTLVQMLIQLLLQSRTS